MADRRTVLGLIEKLSQEAERDRAVEAEMRRRAASRERAIDALRSVLDEDGGGEQLPLTPAAPSANGQPALRGKRAVTRIISEEPERIWRPSEIHAALQDRGWVTPGIKNAKQATETAISRLVDQGLVEKLGRGKYRWVGFREGPPAE